MHRPTTAKPEAKDRHRASSGVQSHRNRLTGPERVPSPAGCTDHRKQEDLGAETPPFGRSLADVQVRAPAVVAALPPAARVEETRTSAPGDPREEEADRFAEQFVSSTRTTPGAPGAHAVMKVPRRVASLDRHPTARDAGESPVDVTAAVRRLGPGTALSPTLRAAFEPRLGRDLGDVRVHTTTRAADAARALGANAFVMGADVTFGAGQWQPDTLRGRRLIAHELAHVAQQGLGRTNLSDNVSEPRVVDRQRANSPGAGAAPARPQLKHRYHQSGFRPSTGFGGFNEIEYNSETQVFQVTIRPRFDFPDMNLRSFPAEVRNDPASRQEAERQIRLKKAAFIDSFVRQAEAWGGHHTFFCQEPGLTALRATVRVDVDLAPDPPGETQTVTNVHVTDTDVRDNTGRGTNTMHLGIQSGLGVAQYDAATNKMTPTSVGPPMDLRGIGEHGADPGGATRPGIAEPRKNAPEGQPVITHELGHTFGLGDEYVEAGKPEYAAGMPTDHSKLAKAMLGKTVTHGANPDSIMAGGSSILPEHGVTFLEALRTVTRLAWDFGPAAKEP